MVEFKFGLGDRVKDRISGFSGIVIARTDWLNQCHRYSVQPEAMHEGKPLENQGFDEGDLVLVKANVHPPKIAFEVVDDTPARRRTGGPAPAVSRSKDPTR